MKIVISSHIRYTTPLALLFESFNTHCPSIYADVIVVINGCQNESVSYDVHLNACAPLTVITTHLDIWEYTIFPTITKYWNNENVSSEFYMLLHDTCIVGPKFQEKINKHSRELTAYKRNPLLQDTTTIGILRPKGYCSNIVIIHKRVIFMYEKEVHSITTKKDAVAVERGELKSFYDYDVPTVDLKSRVLGRSIDIYDTGYPRLSCYYECFDLHKYILYNRHGEFTGDVKPIFD